MMMTPAYHQAKWAEAGRIAAELIPPDEDRKRIKSKRRGEIPMSFSLVSTNNSAAVDLLVETTVSI